MPPRSFLVPRWLVGALALVLAITALGAPVAAQDQSESDSITVALADAGESGVSGEATLDADGDQTNLTVRLTGAFDDHLIGIASRSCANFDPADPEPEGMSWVTDPDGFSDATVPDPLDDLVAGDYSITVRQSEAEPGELIACGDIGGTDSQDAASDVATDTDSESDIAAAGGTDTASADPTGMPTTGVGSASMSDLRLALVFSGLAALSAAIAIAIARRPGINTR